MLAAVVDRRELRRAGVALLVVMIAPELRLAAAYPTSFYA
jgi:hypothetical protein